MRSVFSLIFLFTLILAKAQDPGTEKDANVLIDRLIQNSNISADEDAAEILLQYFYTPLDINKASAEELRALLILNESEINSILNYRKDFGSFLSIYEIQAVPDLNMETIRFIIPFITVSFEKEKVKDLLDRIKNNQNKYLMTRYGRYLERSSAYESRLYEGSPDRWMFRFRNSKNKDFSFHVLMEKDAGESFAFNGRKQGADFISAHAMISEKGIIKNFIAGDFLLQFGQGLIFGPGFSLGKSSETVTAVRKANTGIRPFTSSVESGFFRGTGITLQKGENQGTFFISRTKNDGYLRIDSTGETDNFSSFNYSGLHRSYSEIVNRHNIGRSDIGGNISKNFLNGKLQIGINSVFTKFDHSVLPSYRPYNIWYFTGTENFSYSISSTYQWQNFNFFSEYGRSISGGNGVVAGFISSLSSKFDFSFIYRNYEAKFHSFYGNAFAESSNSNERGYYFGCKLKPVSKITIASYYDYFIFPWLKYQVSSPSQGYEYLIKITYQFSKKDDINFQFKGENREQNILSDSDKIQQVGEATRYSGFMDLQKTLTDLSILKSRIILNEYKFNHKKSYGYFLMEEMEWKIKRTNLIGRFSIFDAPLYENAFYVYERDVLYAFSIPQIYGKGVRTYLILNKKLGNNLDVWIKFARTKHYDRNVIGTYPDLIKGSRKSEVRLQLRYIF